MITRIEEFQKMLESNDATSKSKGNKLPATNNKKMLTRDEAIAQRPAEAINDRAWDRAIKSEYGLRDIVSIKDLMKSYKYNVTVQTQTYAKYKIKNAKKNESMIKNNDNNTMITKIKDFVRESNENSDPDFNARKVWEFINSRPFNNPSYKPMFNIASEIYDEAIKNNPVIKKKYDEFKWSGLDTEHPDETAVKNRRDTYDQLAANKKK